MWFLTSLVDNLILPILAGVAIYLICKWIDKRLR